MWGECRSLYMDIDRPRIKHAYMHAYGQKSMYLDAGARREVADRGAGGLAEEGEEDHGPVGAVRELAQVRERLLGGAHLFVVGLGLRWVCVCVCWGGC